MKKDYDVIVVGGGGAGLSAAIMAHDAGASVMILEADTHLGGATMLAGGVFYAAGTSVQKAAGIEDSPDAMFEYIVTLNQWDIRHDLVRILCDKGAEAIDWLLGFGADFPKEWLVCSGVESVPRAHCSRGAGGTVAEALVNAAGSRGIDTALATRVERLLVEEGRVVGVHAGGMDLFAPSVVITTGGFGNSREMIERLYPTAAFHGDRVYAVHHHAPFILGDGIKMAEKIGANIAGHDQGLLLTASGTAGRVLETETPPWCIIVNREGRRFMSETAPYAVNGYLLNSQTDRLGFAIFDEATLVEASSDIKYLDKYNSGMNSSTYGEQTIKDRVRKGEVKAADSIDELARKIGVDPDNLSATVERYNADCDQGRDSLFLKKLPKYHPIRKPPFYAVELRAYIIGSTGAGLEIDSNCRVLDTHQRPIPGLYAAGEVLGGVQGKRYSAGGLMIANAVIFGRLAGESAAEDARRLAMPEEVNA